MKAPFFNFSLLIFPTLLCTRLFEFPKTVPSRFSEYFLYPCECSFRKTPKPVFINFANESISWRFGKIKDPHFYDAPLVSFLFKEFSDIPCVSYNPAAAIFSHIGKINIQAILKLFCDSAVCPNAMLTFNCCIFSSLKQTRCFQRFHQLCNYVSVQKKHVDTHQRAKRALNVACCSCDDEYEKKLDPSLRFRKNISRHKGLSAKARFKRTSTRRSRHNPLLVLQSKFCADTRS